MRGDLRTTFRPQSYFYHVERKLHNTVQGSMTIDEYHRTLEMLLEHGDIVEDESKTIARFLHGLHKDISWGMNTQRYASMDDALDAARESERKLNERKAYRSRQARWTSSRPSQTAPRRDVTPPNLESKNLL